MTNKESVERISPETAKSEMEAGKAVMVCAYDDEHCKSMQIEGTLLRGDFVSKLSNIPKDKEIIFYCN